mgnify:CR=1 FL=1|jgi:hypothetical protein
MAHAITVLSTRIYWSTVNHIHLKLERTDKEYENG